jgi:hypothetical protein
MEIDIEKVFIEWIGLDGGEILRPPIIVEVVDVIIE